MKKVIVFIIVVLVLGAGWYLLSPLFINQTVDEGLPVNLDTTQQDSQEMPEDIIIGQDVVMDEPMVEMESETSVETRGSFTGADRSTRVKVISW